MDRKLQLAILAGSSILFTLNTALAETTALTPPSEKPKEGIFAEMIPWWCQNKDSDPKAIQPSYTEKTKVCLYELACPGGVCEPITISYPQGSIEKPLFIGNVALNKSSGATLDMSAGNTNICTETNHKNFAIGDKQIRMRDGSKKDGPTSCVIKLINVKTNELSKDDNLVTYNLKGGYSISVKLKK